MALVLFRTDASHAMGAGHVMRCLSLARALRETGAVCVFLSHAQPLSMLDAIRDQGFELIERIDLQSTESKNDDVAYESQADLHVARNYLRRIGKESFDWLVVDHYQLDHRWETPMRTLCHRVFVIDDLVNRKHDGDVLLDTGMGRSEDDYRPLMPGHARLLLGPRYALLRPEFSRLRQASLRRRQHALEDGLHLLISMGGVDLANFSEAILQVLKDTNWHLRHRITAILGKGAPHFSSVKAMAESMGAGVRVLENVADMAQQMAEADLAVGAPGGASWERCCLGLPVVMLVQADNQLHNARMLNDAQAGLWVSHVSEVPAALQKILNDMSTYVQHSASLVDGSGAARVAEEMTSCLD